MEKFVAPDIKSPDTELVYISLNSNARIATKSFQPNLESGQHGKNLLEAVLEFNRMNI